MQFLIALSLVSVVLFAGCVQPTTEVALAQPTGVKHDIMITSSGFSPVSLGINAGDTVVFTNNDDSEHWPATDIHPTHANYPGSGLQKCLSGEDTSKIFDACHELNKGETYEFTFLIKGNWCYHDHMHPNLEGCINVQ